MLGDEDQRRGGTELASGVEGGVRRAPGRLRSTRGAPAVRPGVQGGPELNGGEQLLKSESSPAWRSSAKIRRCRGLGRGRRARGPPGAQADLARGSGGAGAWWSVGSAPVQGHGVAEHGGAGWRRR